MDVSLRIENGMYFEDLLSSIRDKTGKCIVSKVDGKTKRSTVEWYEDRHEFFRYHPHVRRRGKKMIDSKTGNEFTLYHHVSDAKTVDTKITNDSKEKIVEESPHKTKTIIIHDDGASIRFSKIERTVDVSTIHVDV